MTRFFRVPTWSIPASLHFSWFWTKYVVKENVISPYIPTTIPHFSRWWLFFFTHSLSISTGFTRFVDSLAFLDPDPRPEKYLAAGHGAQDLQRQGPQAALGAGVDGGTAEDDVPRNRGRGHGLPQLQHLGHTMARMARMVERDGSMVSRVAYTLSNLSEPIY